MEHKPVLREEVQKYLDLKSGEVVVDATLGLGGHALDIVEKIGKKGLLYAFEQDERNLEQAKARLKKYEKQIVCLNDNFCHLKTRVYESSKELFVDAILFDLGLSSPHVDDPQRGFSFMKEGPLDMRFDPRSSLTAEMVVNTYSEKDLADIFYFYGEERMARRIAKKICEQRKMTKFITTLDLANFMAKISPSRAHGKTKIHPATRVFQALRIAVNDELNVLKQALAQAFEILKPNGRIVVISYHSLEDRIVKDFFNTLLRPAVTDQKQALYRNFGEPLIEVLNKRPVTPSEKELINNPRSRSSKLRAAKKITSPHS